MSNNLSILPNFILIGAGKAGTSSLAHYLRQHPDIFVSTPKELNYFAFTDANLAQYNLADQQWIQNSITTLDAYQQKFSQVKHETAIGEASGIYMFHPQAAARIQAMLPEVKLMAILRNPIDRAYSGYQMHLRRGTETRTFMTAVQEDLTVNPRPYMKGCYLQKGWYFQQLEVYFKLFKREQIQIFLYEELCQQPQQLLQRMYSFLNVDPDFKVNLEQKFNAAPNYTGALTLADKQQLLALSTPDIIKLQTLIQRDLSSWLKF